MERRGLMFFRVVLFLWEFLLDVAAISRRTESEKDLQILLLRQQLRIVERKQVRGPQLPRWQKVPLAALASRLQQVAHQGCTALADSVRLFQPATLIGWHRELVRRKWTVQPPCPAGRPPVKEEVEQWIGFIRAFRADEAYMPEFSPNVGERGACEPSALFHLRYLTVSLMRLFVPRERSPSQ